MWMILGGEHPDHCPSGMETYLDYYGWHFSKKMEEWAASRMWKGEGEFIVPYTKAELEAKMGRSVTYDAVYIANMCKADFLGSSIPDEAHLLKYVVDGCEDPDAYDGMPITRFYADCVKSKTPIHWEDMI